MTYLCKHYTWLHSSKVHLFSVSTARFNGFKGHPQSPVAPAKTTDNNPPCSQATDTVGAWKMQRSSSIHRRWATAPFSRSSALMRWGHGDIGSHCDGCGERHMPEPEQPCSTTQHTLSTSVGQGQQLLGNTPVSCFIIQHTSCCDVTLVHLCTVHYKLDQVHQRTHIWWDVI